MSKNRKSSYFDRWREWQDNMYSPGAYAGKPLPYNEFNRNRKIGLFNLYFQALIFFIGGLFIFYIDDGISRIFGLAFVCLAILFIFGYKIKKK